jgi:ubiquinone/menaquinone biosynthesis C-methylase UbiE
MDYESINRKDGCHLTDSFTPYRYRQISRLYKGVPERILDIGIGSGIGGIELRKAFPSTVLFGLDAVAERAKSAHEVYDKVLYGSASHSLFEPNFFDLVVAGELIEHILPAEVDSFLHEVFRILKIGGYFIFTSPNPNDIKLKIRRSTVLGSSHLSQHFIRETQMRLRQNSFRVKRVLGTGKTSKLLGMRMPKLVYGSYMIIAQKF